MSHDEPGTTWPPLAIAEHVNRDEGLLTQLEGILVLAGGRSESISPKEIGDNTDISVGTATDVFRQLSQTDAVERESFESNVSESSYRVDVETCRNTFETARCAARSVTAYEERQPPATKATPLVTFPDDPAFADVSPPSFGMSWLMPAITRQIKRAEEEIVLLAPFFEEDGFAHFEEVLLSAMEDGVDVTVVSRYLNDPSSHNRTVLESFARKADERGVEPSHLSFVDYTRWNSGTPTEKQHQDGAIPAFTLHAKVILFDNVSAYIGSANVTDYGFEHYLETGILLEGPPVNGFVELVCFLLDSTAATSVSLIE